MLPAKDFLLLQRWYSCKDASMLMQQTLRSDVFACVPAGFLDSDEVRYVA